MKKSLARRALSGFRAFQTAYAHGSATCFFMIRAVKLQKPPGIAKRISLHNLIVLYHQ
ncbi:MAG: hypothetical protein LBU32_05285 [Clostridiales bacterium]|jgi:hypothetical protein|nr:hypothetical protein [Clostridiales bacterium]